MRPPARALAALEVAVGGRGATLAGREPVRIHAEAHRAAGLAPLEAGIAEDAVEALALGLLLHQARARHDQRELDVGGAGLAFYRRGAGAPCLQARVGGGADAR